MMKVKPNIAGMATYAPPWQGMDRGAYLRLDLNENTLPIPEHVKQALKRYIDENRIQMYPEYAPFIIKLADYVNVEKENILLTNGSDQAIEIILRAFLSTGDVMLMAQPGFPMFTQIASVIGACITGVSYGHDLTFPYNAFTEAIGKKIKLVIIVNPDNPTGVSVDEAYIKGILEMFPLHPVFVDEAYFEFTGKTALTFLDSHPNLIITRTFSKAFALAGLRLGYIIAHPDLISQFSKIRGPFDVNSCALIAAEAQIDHTDEWTWYVKEVMDVSKPYLEGFFKENSVRFYRGAANFMLVEPEERDKAVAYLKTQGILVRPMTASLIDKTFRMNIGTLVQTERFCEVYKAFLKGD